jgi:hypothetical protein
MSRALRYDACSQTEQNEMNALGKQAIEAASKRGMNFHVFSSGIWQTSWNSYGVAKAVAAKEINGAVYNSQFQKV